jgi:hypothetical protein
MIRIKLIGLNLFFIFGLAIANDFCGIKNATVRSGEKIRYKVLYHWGAMNIGAGEVTFTTQYEKFQNKNTYHLIGEGGTYKSYDWFFKVRDKYESYVDTATMLPLKFIRKVNEGGYKISNNVSFNHKERNAISEIKSIKIPSCTQDVLSTIYYARNLAFTKYKIGDKIPFDMYIDDQVFSLYIKYLGKEKITIGLGTFNAIVFKPLLINGTIFKGGVAMRVWASDDLNHVPLRVESPISVGDIRVDLISHSGLKYPMTSKIK